MSSQPLTSQTANGKKLLTFPSSLMENVVNNVTVNDGFRLLSNKSEQLARTQQLAVHRNGNRSKR